MEIKSHGKLLLASQSPRRKHLLEMANIAFDTVASHADESFPPDLPILQIPVHIALSKANAIRKKAAYKDYTILAADTIVAMGNEIMGKPKDRTEALEMLSKLSGNTHQVITGIVLLPAEGQQISFAETTDVTFRTLTQAQIDYYIDHYQPYDKAGAYGIQEWLGLVGIKSIDGDYYNVMGMPVGRLLEEAGGYLL